MTIEKVPSSIIECLSHFETFWLYKCTRLKSLPSNIYKLHYLTILSLAGCSEIKSLPELPISIRLCLVEEKNRRKENE